MKITEEEAREAFREKASQRLSQDQPFNADAFIEVLNDKSLIMTELGEVENYYNLIMDELAKEKPELSKVASWAASIKSITIRLLKEKESKKE